MGEEPATVCPHFSLTPIFQVQSRRFLLWRMASTEYLARSGYSFRQARVMCKRLKRGHVEATS